MPDCDIRSYSKNFDVTFSFLYHYLIKILKKTKRLVVYMDNCPATNKNNFTFWFFYYCIHRLKLFNEVVICCMQPGHTKFSPDRWFGTFKNIINNYSEDIESYP